MLHCAGLPTRQTYRKTLAHLVKLVNMIGGSRKVRPHGTAALMSNISPVPIMAWHASVQVSGTLHCNMTSKMHLLQQPNSSVGW